MRDELGPVPLKDLSASRLEVLLNAKAGELAPKSLNHLRGHIHRIFELAIRRGLFAGLNPAKTVRASRSRRRSRSTSRPGRCR